MRSSPTLRAGAIAVTCIIIFTFLSITRLHAEGDDSVRRRIFLLYIEKINSDCYSDTVWGAREGSINAPSYLPTMIVWGKEARKKEGNDIPPHCRSHIPDKKKVEYTLITYPAWKDLGGSIDVRRFNPEDTLPDMVIALRGKVGEGGNEQDSVRLLVIFNQHGLDTISTIDLAAIPSFQSSPFTAAELRRDIEIVKEKKRDISGRKSYELLPVGFTVLEPDTTRNVPAPMAGALRVYPNPADVATQIEAESISPGEYEVEVVAVNGEVRLRQDVVVSQGGSLFRTFDLRKLPSGYYVIRLLKNLNLVGAYPIIVTR